MRQPSSTGLHFVMGHASTQFNWAALWNEPCVNPVQLGCTFPILHQCTFAILHKCALAILHQCTFAIVHKCALAIVHKCTFPILHQCTFATLLTLPFSFGPKMHFCNPLQIRALAHMMVQICSGRSAAPSTLPVSDF